MPDDGPVDSHLLQLRDLGDELHHVEGELPDIGDDDTEDTIIRNFIPAPLPLLSEDRAINDAR